MALQALYIGPIQFLSSELRQRISSVCIARAPFELDVAAGSAVMVSRVPISDSFALRTADEAGEGHSQRS